MGDRTGRPQWETTRDHNGRPQRETTMGDHTGRPQWETTTGDHSGRPQWETMGDNGGQQREAMGGHVIFRVTVLDP
eukprot:16307615-Heterocapsa_arctica.AAC.1